MSCTAITVFAKLPLPGLVKTRLARGVGPAAAACFYRACATHILRQAAGRCAAIFNAVLKPVSATAPVHFDVEYMIL